MVTLAVAKNSNTLQIRMFKRLKEIYREYKPYVRVDLIMYGVLILLIILYFIISTVID